MVTLVDTSGAFPGIEAEERGQAEAIARSTEACLALPTPMVAAIVGEGGSGGAVALASAERVLMLEHAVYSVISPEGCASILWRTAEKAPLAAEAMKMTAQDLLALGVIDRIVPEPVGGAHRDPHNAALDLGAGDRAGTRRAGQEEPGGNPQNARGPLPQDGNALQLREPVGACRGSHSNALSHAGNRPATTGMGSTSMRIDRKNPHQIEDSPRGRRMGAGELHDGRPGRLDRHSDLAKRRPSRAPKPIRRSSPNSAAR